MQYVLNVAFHILADKLCKDLDLDSVSRSYIMKRTHAEGLSFLSKTLPKLSKAVLYSLEKGDKFHRPTDFKWKGASLELCSVWLDRIFDRRTGRVLAQPCPYALKNIRQLCEYFYKFTLPFNEEDVKNAENKVLEIEHKICSTELDQTWTDKVRITFENLYPSISRSTVQDVFKHSEPRFGPGAFAGSNDLIVKDVRNNSSQKVHHSVYKQRSDTEIGTTSTVYRAHSGYFKPYPSAPERVNIVSEENTSEVVIVPKDSRGPRIISKEPLHLLRGQMAYFGWLSKSLEKDSGKRINFSDQTVNRELARKGSLSRRFATLDLKDASDMMSFDLCRAVFRNSPAIRWFISNARSTHTKLPYSKEVIPLRKLSGMGSGLTFPTMALLIQLSIVTSVRERMPWLSYRKIARQVYVYGDDIIVPNNWYDFACTGLRASGFVTNTDKSYFRSFFRESCGGDYYKGVNVSPVRFKMSNNGVNSLKSRRIHNLDFNGPGSILQLERHCRELARSHFSNVKEFIYERLEATLGQPLPVVTGESPILGRYELNFFATDYNFSAKKSYLPLAEHQSDPGTSPWKYIARFFKLSGDGTWEGVFGSIAAPRSVKLKKKSMPAISFYS